MLSLRTSLFVNLIFFSLSHGQVFKTQPEVLKEAFPRNSTVERKVLFLTDEQVFKIENLAKAKLESKLATYYVSSANDSVNGYAFFETNIVRTKPETFVVIINPSGSVRSVEILAFHEPLDYLPTPRWFKLFTNKFLDDDLWPKRGIHNITGATLSVQAITQGVRKILAIHRVALHQETVN
jgi:Na+-translocating ferredoxin:NAD+ oxidoreductase RnfG subunit